MITDMPADPQGPTGAGCTHPGLIRTQRTRLQWLALAALCSLTLLAMMAAATTSSAGAALPVSAPANDLTRQREVVVLPGSILPELNGAPLEELFLYAYEGTGWTQIPFQWDEVEPISNTYTVYEDGLLDGNDELSFLAGDGGQQAPAGAWIANNASTAYGGYELAVDDPLHPGEQAWAYLFRSPTLTTTFGAGYLQVTTDTVTSPFFSAGVNFSETLGLTALSLNGHPADIIDRSHISIKGTLFIFPIQYCEEDLAALITGTVPITGIIPPEDKPVRYVTGPAGDRGGVYPASLRLLDGAFDLDALAAAIPVPGLTLQELRVSLDLLNPAASGFAPATYMNGALAPGGVAVDGVPDAVPGTLTSWSQINGSYGSIIQLGEVQVAGTSAFLYYRDDAAATAADCHGDDGAFGENGVRIAPFSGAVTLTQQLYFSEPLTGAAGPTYQAYAANPLQVTAAVRRTCYYADVEPNADHGNPDQCDGDVDVADVVRVAGCWGQAPASPGCPAALDLNGDGLIDVADIADAATAWGWPP